MRHYALYIQRRLPAPGAWRFLAAVLPQTLAASWRRRAQASCCRCWGCCCFLSLYSSYGSSSPSPWSGSSLPGGAISMLALPLERELEEAERLSQRNVNPRNAPRMIMCARPRPGLPDDSNNHDWPDTVSAPIAPGFSSYASFENPMPQEMFMANHSGAVGSVRCTRQRAARESGYARYNPSPGISSRTSSNCQDKQERTPPPSPCSRSSYSPPPRFSQALQAPPAPEISPSTSSISARSQLRLVPRVEDAPESPQEDRGYALRYHTGICTAHRSEQQNVIAHCSHDRRPLRRRTKDD